MQCKKQPADGYERSNVDMPVMTVKTSAKSSAAGRVGFLLAVWLKDVKFISYTQILRNGKLAPLGTYPNPHLSFLRTACEMLLLLNSSYLQ